MESVHDALAWCRTSFIAVFVFSFFANLLMLTPMFYMINVFDKAVGTGSFPTLISLAAIAAFLYVVMALMEWSRSRVLVFVASRIDHLLAPRIYDICFSGGAGTLGAAPIGSQPLTDLNSLRQFLTGGTVIALFDLPWLPLYLVVMLLFHPALAVVAIICMGIMFLLALGNQRATTSGLNEANSRAGEILQQTRHNLRNAEVAGVMGMIPVLTERWRSKQDAMLGVQEKASNAAGRYSAAIKSMTTAMQSAAITTGAVLAMQQEISPGVMIGAALLLSRALAPIQQAVTGWKGLVEAAQQYQRLNGLLANFPPAAPKMPLPSIAGAVSAKAVSAIPPGAKKPVLFNINFDIPSGSVVMILGASAAGKSSLARTILGLWPTAQGKMCIDGAEVTNFDRAQLGPQIGYLPQDIELFDGTIADNICRFDEINSELVIQAANDADVHDMILALPEGYDTVISGTLQGVLSPGQRQRVALARALYNRPKLVLLDEPNSNLDEAGERALNGAIQGLKSAGSTVILVSHRHTALPLVDHLIVMKAGRIHDQGPTADIIEKSRRAVSAQKEAAAQQKAQTLSGGAQ
jgi:ATP-binding cassette, subfamily C, bacterial EexD